MVKKPSSIWIFVVLAFLLPAAAYAIVNWYEQTFTALPVFGKEEVVNGKTMPHRIDSFKLINQDAVTKQLGDWDGKILVADFFFTHCPSICPRLTANLKRVQEAYNHDDDVAILSFSVDPERDSSMALQKYAQRFSINTRQWQLLTGSKQAIYKLARNSFEIVATDGDGGPDDFIHSEKLVLVDRQRRFRGYYDGTDDTAIKNLIRDIKKLQHEE
jgi:protein SCO1/2